MIRCIGCLIYDSERDEFLLQQRSKTSSYPMKWGLWGGKLERNETFIDALKRELKEELELDFHPDDMKPLDMYVSEDGSFVYSSFVLVTHKLTEFKTNSKETNDFVWLPLQSLLKIDLHPATLIALTNKFHVLEKIVSDIKQT